jgi:hypothetical protein
MVIVPRRTERFGNDSVNLVANINEDRREELIWGAPGDLIPFAQWTAVVGRVTLELNWITDFKAHGLNISTFPKCHTIEHAPQRRIGGHGVGDKTGPAVGPSEDGGRTGNLKRRRILAHEASIHAQSTRYFVINR